MEELRKVFEARDSAFEKKTLEIFEMIHTTLVSVTTFLNEIDPMLASGTIEWEDANILDDDQVVIIGTVNYAPGVTVEVEGSLTTITEENLDYFQRVIHMALPFDLVESRNEEKIMEFLKEIYDKSVIEEGEEDTDIPVSAETEFDLSKLTEEQRQSLRFCSTKGKS